MKKLERKNFFKNEIFQARDNSNANTYKVRSGIVGGYSNELSKSDEDYINNLVSKCKCPYVR